MQSISVVIPVYNAEQTLTELYHRLISAMEELTDSFEVIMIEDCGTDHSWEMIKALAENDNRIIGKKLSRNYGQHNALLCGIRTARYELTLTMDDDLQHPVREIKKLIDKLNEGFDVVYGSPKQEKHTLWRNIASILTKITLKKAMGINAARNVSAFRVFRTRIRDAFADFQSPSVSIDVLLAWGSHNFSSIKVAHDSRLAGTSNYTFRSLLRHAVDVYTGYSAAPLQLASIMGFVFTLFGFCILAWVLVNYFIHDISVPGFSFLASIIAIFSGVQLFALGIFGEYLSRLHFRTMNRPIYTVIEECNSELPVDVQ